MVARKLLSSGKPAKERKPRVQKVSSKKLDMEKLQDAVVDGKLAMTPESKLVVSRWGREIHNCTFLQLDTKFNIIEMWDDTVQHMYSVSLNEPLPETFKVTRMAAKSAPLGAQPAPIQAVAEPLQEVSEPAKPVLSDGTLVVEAETSSTDRVSEEFSDETILLHSSSLPALGMQSVV